MCRLTRYRWHVIAQFGLLGRAIAYAKLLGSLTDGFWRFSKSLSQTYKNRDWKPEGAHGWIIGFDYTNCCAIPFRKGIRDQLKTFTVHCYVLGCRETEVLNPHAVLGSQPSIRLSLEITLCYQGHVFFRNVERGESHTTS
jgi:hypothetical protein